MYLHRLSIAILFAVLLSIRPSMAVGQTNEVDVTYIAHASFLISYDGFTLLVDPFADTTWIGYRFPPNIIANAALITHPHYDHDGGRFRGKTPYWEDKMPIYENVGEFQVGPFKITGVKGKHSDPYGKEFDQKNVIWIIEVAGLKLVHLGDNGPLTTENYQQIGKPDILFAPIDETFHILQEDELRTVLLNLNPNILVPMHYRLPDLEKPGSPKNLGDIAPYLIGKKGVSRLEGNMKKFSRPTLKNESATIVFQHHSKVVR